MKIEPEEELLEVIPVDPIVQEMITLDRMSGMDSVQ
jgi:hypothetical protein